MDTMDWVADKNSTAYHSADEITEKILKYGNGKKYGANGAIVLMHLGTNREEDYPHQKLPEIIEGLRKQGYRLVKMSELIQSD
jgi:peptidoglycan/xylan/chitin deacetylase (PgdA/CDA1 family)